MPSASTNSTKGPASASSAAPAEQTTTEPQDASLSQLVQRSPVLGRAIANLYSPEQKSKRTRKGDPADIPVEGIVEDEDESANAPSDES